jgi:hypothetical protein
MKRNYKICSTTIKQRKILPFFSFSSSSSSSSAAAAATAASLVSYRISTQIETQL